MTDHARENLLLLETARYPLVDHDPERIRDLADKSLDWDYVLSTAGRHGLAPMMFQTLVSAKVEEGIPDQKFEILRRTYLTSLLNNRKLYESLTPVLEMFADNTIPVILLKGAALCLNTYTDMALRPFGDLDILVHKKDVPLCRKLLSEYGFVLIEGSYFPVPDDQNDELGCEWSYHLNGAVVELHWGLIDRMTSFPIDIQRFWNGAKPVEVNGRPALIMSPENQLIHLCLHQYKHHWEHLRDLTDIALVLEKYGDALDWNRVVADSRSQGLNRCVFFSLDLAHRILGVSISSVPMSEILGRSQPARISLVMRDLIVSHMMEQHLPRRFWELILVEGLRNRIRLLIRIIAHPFPREELPQAKSTRESTVIGKSRETLKSIYYYRWLVLKVPRQLVRLIKHRSKDGFN